jgi:hypothetical protein
MRVKDLLLQALSRANHIEDGSPADARELNKARTHFNSALSAYSDSNLITAFQRVLDIDSAVEECVIGKYNLKRGKVMHEAASLDELPDPRRMVEGNDYGHVTGSSNWYYIANVYDHATESYVHTWIGATGATSEERLANTGCCDYIPDIILPDIERIVGVMSRRKEDHGMAYRNLDFVPLSSFYSNDGLETYCAHPVGENKVKLVLPSWQVGRQLKVVYNTSMKFSNDDYIELPEVYKELLTLATTVGLLSEDADADPTQLKNYTMMMEKLENQVMANNANTRRIVRKDERRWSPLYTGAFICRRIGI